MTSVLQKEGKDVYTSHAMESCVYPLTQMSDIFSPVMKASSSRITSSVFQIITRSSKLDNSTALTRGEREDDRQTGDTPQRQTRHKNAQRKKWKQTNKQKKWLTAKKKKKIHTQLTPTGQGFASVSRCTYPLTNMSLDFSPVKKSSSSSITSSVFQIITLSSYLVKGGGRNTYNIHSWTYS